MTLKRFKKLGQYLHPNDEEERPDQQSADFEILYKARPALDLMDKFTQAYIPGRELAVEEAIQNNDLQKQFYPRVDNRTDITFSNDELAFLNKGLKYNLNYKHKNWIETLALEAETATSYLPHTEQEYLRYQISHNVKLLYKHYSSHKYDTYNTNKERQTLYKIKNKLRSNKAIITKADKGNTIVITYQQEYHNKIKDFIIDNNLITINDPTKNFQKKIKKVLNECQIVTHKNEKWKYVNLNPSAPSIRGMIKIHKTGAPSDQA
jgi:hypothetical protein